jgi:hypothetical protein
MVTISSRAAAIASGAGVCERADPANNTIKHTISVHEYLRMKALLWGRVMGSELIVARTQPVATGTMD